MGLNKTQILNIFRARQTNSRGIVTWQDVINIESIGFEALKKLRRYCVPLPETAADIPVPEVQTASRTTSRALRRRSHSQEPHREGYRTSASRSLARHISDPQTPPRIFPAMPGSLTGSTDPGTPLSDSRTHGVMSAGVVESKPELILFGAGKARLHMWHRSAQEIATLLLTPHCQCLLVLLGFEPREKKSEPKIDQPFF